MSNNSRSRKFHVKSDKVKTREKETVLNKKLYIIVNRQHRLVYHKKGHAMFFNNKKQAQKWLLENNTEALDWRIERLEVTILR